MVLSTLTEKQKMEKIDEIVSNLPLYGLQKKYAKQLNDRKIADNTILGVHKYNIEGSRVIRICIKRTYGCGKRTEGSLCSCYYIESICPYTGKSRWLRPTYSIYGGSRCIGYAELTNHFIKRVKERTGMDFLDFLLATGTDNIGSIKYDGDDRLFLKWGDYTLFGYRGETDEIFYITTMVTPDMLFDNQKSDYDELGEFNKEFEEKKNQLMRA